MFFDNTTLHFSYATCGHVDRFYGDYGRQLRSQTLRISFPEAYGGASLITVPPDRLQLPVSLGGPTMPGTNRAGWTVSFAAQVFAAHNVTFVEVDVPATTPDGWGEMGLGNYDTWIGCVVLVALNRTDVCIGDFWPTPNRRAHGISFTHVIWEEPIKVVTAKTHQGSHLSEINAFDEVLAILDPFSQGVWLALAGVLLLVAITIFVVGEGGTARAAEFESCAARAGDALFVAALGLPEGAGRMTGSGAPATLIILAVAWSLLVFQTQYTAQVTTNSIVSSRTVTGLKEAAYQSMTRVCMLNALRT